MKGRISWNLAFAVFGFGVTLLLSLSRNVWTTSLIRAVLCGVFFFFLMFLIRFVLSVLLAPPKESSPSSGYRQEEQDSHKGRSLDITTPEDPGSLKELLNPQGILRKTRTCSLR
ncbi:hypothetical protein N6H14_24710 [Paenibacillus sp. CC-CFT747]|nr:hypothetical protein N6H14_24710 [Paenibacillus sp. CC-CFT747]